jgi:hypothetical protein
LRRIYETIEILGNSLFYWILDVRLSNIARSLIPEVILFPINNQLYVANHTKISSLGETEIKLDALGKIIGAKVVVSDEIDSVILRSDFFRGHNAVWNFSTAKITLDGFVFYLRGRPKTGHRSQSHK